MIDKASAIEIVVRKLKKLPAGKGLDLRTYKRDRSVMIIRNDEDSFTFTVDGYANEEFKVDFQGLKKALKKLMKSEFPRSNKVRVYDVG